MDQATPMPCGARVRERVAEPRYRPIRDYAAIGDCHGAALVSRDGSIDWCTLRRFDADPVFCRILDAERGGFWSIRPLGEYRAARSYLEGTNILRTVFSTRGGEVAVTDFMPVGRRLDAGPHDYVSLNAPFWLVRRVEGLRGAVELLVRYRPSRAFARHPTELMLEEGAIHGEGVPSLFTDLEFTAEGDAASARVTLHAGSYRDLVLAASTVPGHRPTERVSEFFRITRAFWEEWIAGCRYQGPHRDAVRRSALALKLMTYAPSGALVAALTTSLPEEVGGERNWDQRFCWLRDACATFYALAALGYGAEARRFHDYLAGAVRQSLPRIETLYGIGREHELTERVLDHLDGHAGSRPVRVGHGAHRRRQIDVYGQVLDLALLHRSLGGALDQQYRRLLASFAEFVAAHWQEPDQGLWAMRGPPRHHVHGKLMSWVAMDRARQLFDDGRDWAALAGRIRDEVLARAVDRERRHLAQGFDGGLDAAVLLAPMLGFPAGGEVLDQTIDSLEHALARGDFLRRYQGPDGLAGDEGAFLVCSFWLVDAKLAAGRADEASALLGRLVRCANDVGLYAEEIDPHSGAFLGNFPQALTHLALIGSAVNLRLYRRNGARALSGSYALRARRAVEPGFGWRGLRAMLERARGIARLRSSPASKLAWP